MTSVPVSNQASHAPLWPRVVVPLLLALAMWGFVGVGFVGLWLKIHG